MAYDVDYLLDGKENLIGMINEANVSEYTRDHLDLGTPQFNTDPPPAGKDPCNTKIDVNGNQNTALTGVVTIRYNRLDLNDVINVEDFVLENALNEYHTIHDLIPWFLELGYRFTPEDIENDLILTNSSPFDQLIRAKPESIMFIGTGKIKINP